MINNKSIIAIIPARSGSKGLPGKNLKDLNGKPLISWSIHQALVSKYVDVVVVSTDSTEIGSVALNAGAAVPFTRPHYLATDEASTYDAIEHCIKYYKDHGQSFDYVVLLEPTSPLRKESDIDNMIEELEASHESFDSIVSLGIVETHPGILKELKDRHVCNLVTSCEPNLRRQDYSNVYFPYGVGYIAKTDTLLIEKTFYMKRCMGYVIDRWQNYEIDDKYDFVCVQAILSSGDFT